MRSGGVGKAIKKTLKEGMPNQKKGRNLLFEMAENNIPPEQRILVMAIICVPISSNPTNAKYFS